MRKSDIRGNDELQTLKEAFLERIRRLAQNCGETKTGIPAMSVYRYDDTVAPENHIQEPGICVIAQGAKRIVQKESVFQNDRDHYLLTLLDMPVATEIVEASRDTPYLAISMKLDLKVISEMLVDENLSGVFKAPDPEGPWPLQG